MSKLALQAAAEPLDLSEEKLLEPELFEPSPSRCAAHADSIRAHRLRNEIIATRVANRIVNRLGPVVRST
jgi:glutamate dehydrogenase